MKLWIYLSVFNAINIQLRTVRVVVGGISFVFLFGVWV